MASYYSGNSVGSSKADGNNTIIIKKKWNNLVLRENLITLRKNGNKNGMTCNLFKH